MSNKPPCPASLFPPSPPPRRGRTNAFPFSPSAQKGESVKKMREEVSPRVGGIWWGPGGADLKRNLQAVRCQRHRQQMGAGRREACWEV